MTGFALALVLAAATIQRLLQAHGQARRRRRQHRLLGAAAMTIGLICLALG